MTDLFRPRLTVSSKVFQVVLVHLFYNSALFFDILLLILLNVVANLICIFLVSRQLVLLSTLPKFLHPFRGPKRVYKVVLLKNFITIDSNRFFSFFLRFQISFPCKKNGGESVHDIRGLEL